MGLGDQATIKNTEFYIELGRSCNLNCGHCLNRSGNNIPIVELTDSELDLLSHTVNSSANIQTVHFSGGEPTLYKNSILNLQKLIVRKISYSITTNGSIGYDFTDWLENVKIDLIYLSEEYNSIRSNISKAPFNKSDKSELLQFVKVNYFDRWRDFVNDTDFQILSNKTDDYLKKDIKGIWYIKDNIPVGLLIYSYDTNHTVFNCPTIHIGHWGYQKDLVTSLEAKFIKNDWLYELQKIAIKHDFPPLTAIISDFNNSSLNFAIKNNFNITHFRLDSRNLE